MPLNRVKLRFFALTDEEKAEAIGWFRKRKLFVEASRENLLEHTIVLRGQKEGSLRITLPPGIANKCVGSGSAPLEARLKEQAVKKGVTVGVGESCTGGLIASRITDVPGSSGYFLGGVIAYDNDVKKCVLHVGEDTLRDHGAVSSFSACQMAKGVAGVIGAKYCLAVTGIAGPEGGTPEKPVGTVWFGLHTPGGTKSERFFFEGTRKEIKWNASSYGIFLLLKEIRGGACV